MGPKPKYFISEMWPWGARPSGDYLRASTSALTLLLGFPLCTLWWVCERSSVPQIYLSGGKADGAGGGAGAPGERSRPGEVRRHPGADFLMTAISGVSTVRSRTYGIGLNHKPRAKTPSLRVNMIATETFNFSGKLPIQTPFAKAFQYMNQMERLAEGRIVASDVAPSKASLC